MTKHEEGIWYKPEDMEPPACTNLFVIFLTEKGRPELHCAWYEGGEYAFDFGAPLLPRPPISWMDPGWPYDHVEEAMKAYDETQ